MSTTWHIKKMGFVNFWLFDFEEFFVSSGKLLLRGENACGKSIVTQSMVPFMLDGDKTPSRLDPFGSSDRKMEYYFLGASNDKEDETGYLYLQFGKKDSEQSLTLCIGQRAQKGKPMQFWAFILTDGRRIGIDFDLYNRVGGGFVPLTKIECKNKVGDSFFTESSKAYMSEVNRVLYGFVKDDDYDQLIRLMIKVRQPKLTREFRPTKVYEILNESLQTLSDDDMRAMAESLESMDDMESTLQQQRTTKNDILKIQNEYRKYNEYMLAKKADGFLKFTSQYEEFVLKRKQLENNVLSNEKKIVEEKQLVQAYESEKMALQLEKERFNDLGLEETTAKEIRLQEKIQSLTKECLVIDQQINELNDTIRENEEKYRLLGFEQESIDCKITSEIEELNALNDVLQLYDHDDILNDNGVALHRFEQLRVYIDEALQHFARIDNAQIQCDELAITLDREMRELKHLNDCLNECIFKENGERDVIIDLFYKLMQQATEFTIKEYIHDFVSLVKTYNENNEHEAISDLKGSIKRKKESEYDQLKNKLTDERIMLMTMIEEKKEELARFKSEGTFVYPRSDSRSKARALLRKHNIPFISFYEAFNYCGNNQALFESQLIDIGVMDALIVSDDDLTQAKLVLKDESDCIIDVKGKPFVANPLLEVIVEDAKLKDKAIEICCNIAEDDSAFISLNDNGYYKHGVLVGHSLKLEMEMYLGAETRQKAFDYFVGVKQQEIDELLNKVGLIVEELRLLIEKQKKLESEIAQFPSFDHLQELIKQSVACENNVTIKENEVKKLEDNLLQITNRVRQLTVDMVNFTNNYPYGKTKESYSEVRSCYFEYNQSIQRLRQWKKDNEYAISRMESCQQFIDNCVQQVENNVSSFQTRSMDKNGVESELFAVQQLLNNIEFRDKAKRIKECSIRIRDIDEELHRCVMDIGNYTNDNKHLLSKIDEIKKDEERIKSDVYDTERIFQEELRLKFVTKDSFEGSVEAAKASLKLCKNSDLSKQSDEMVTSLTKCYQQYSSNLMNYGLSLEQTFVTPMASAHFRNRYSITLKWQGKIVSVDEFERAMDTVITNTELLLLQKDRELFEGFLSGTLTQKLSQRIEDSKQWISEMSSLMMEMETSMRLNFMLQWHPKAAESEQELNTLQLVKLLAKDRTILTKEDQELIINHFRAKISMARMSALEGNSSFNYSDLLRDALDYRKWFEFRMFYFRSKQNKMECTNAEFNKFSGGEKAMAMYVPLFAAVHAQLKKARKPDHPCIIALDEAFAGVDEKNISSMFELVEQLKFDYVMNSQALWGCYDTVNDLSIVELIRPANSDVVSTINYHWNGEKRARE